MTLTRSLGSPPLLLAPLLTLAAPAAQPKPEPADFLLPNESKMTPFKDRVPMVFVTSNQPEWKTLKGFWTDAAEDAVDPATGAEGDAQGRSR